jgi:phenylalanyl-tRNA synthetase beta chain
MAENDSVMRTSLVPGLLRSVSLALRRGEEDARLFEVGRIYLAREPGEQADTPAEERHALAMVATGRLGPPHFHQRPPPVDLLGVEGALLQSLASMAGIPQDELVHVTAGEVPNCARGGAGMLLREGVNVGWFGRVHPDVLRNLEIDQPLFAAEVDLERLLPRTPARRVFTPLSRFPRVVRDVSLLVDRSIPYGDIIAATRRTKAEGDRAEAFESVALVDRYEGKGIPSGKVSLTLSFSYRRPDRTLTQDEVDAMHARLVELLEGRFGAVRR